MSKRLDPKGLQGAFARRSAPPGGLDFLIPPRPASAPEPVAESVVESVEEAEPTVEAAPVEAPTVEATPAVEATKPAPGSEIRAAWPRPSAFDPAVPPLPEPPRFQRFVIRPAEQWFGAWISIWRKLPRYMTGR